MSHKLEQMLKGERNKIKRKRVRKKSEKII